MLYARFPARNPVPGRALTSGPPLARCAGSAGLEPRRTPWSKTAGTGVTPVEMEAGDGHDLRPCRDMGALGPGRRDRDARSSLAQDGRREASLSLLPLWL